MKSCPYCKEEVRDDATKCRYCQSLLLPPQPPMPDAKDERHVTYVVDTDLIRFAKFATAMLAVFLVVGGYLFGFKIEASVEKLGSLQKEVEKTSEELKKSQADLQAAKSTVTTLKLEVENLLTQAKQTLAEIGKQRDVAVAIVVSIRELSPAQERRLAQIKATEPDRARGVGKLWPNGATIRVAFLGGSSKQRDLVSRVAVEWAKYANLTFKFVDTGASDVRIAFDPANGSTSYVGTDALAVGQKEPTMNLAWVEPEKVLHEFGHVIGLIEEHQNPNAKIKWNRAAILKSMQGPPNFWSTNRIEDFIFKKVPPDQVGDYRDFDPRSIMTPAFPAEQTGGQSIGGASALSESDKQFVRKLYPGR